jgi:ribosome-associated protein
VSEREGPSKSRRKRDAEALQALGEALAALPPADLAPLQLPERLLQAFAELGDISSHEARRRHCQFIGRLMRDVDPAPLRAFLEARSRPSRIEARLFKLTEKWRDRMLDGGDAVLQEFAATHASVTAAERQQLEQTLAAAREGRSGASRRLFRELKVLVEREHDNGAPAGAALLE